MVYGETISSRIVYSLMDLFEIPIRIYDVSKSNYQTIQAILDTGATSSLIPPQRLLYLGYDLGNATQQPLDTVNGPITALSIVVTKITALQQSAECVEITCFNPNANIPEPFEHIGLLGLNFLSQFDNLNISFSQGIISLT